MTSVNLCGALHARIISFLILFNLRKGVWQETNISRKSISLQLYFSYFCINVHAEE